MNENERPTNGVEKPFFDNKKFEIDKMENQKSNLDPVDPNTWTLEKSPEDLLMSKIMRKVNKIKAKCGEICSDDFRYRKLTKKWVVNSLNASVDCKNMFEIMLMDPIGIEIPLPLEKLNKKLKQAFTYNGQLKMQPLYFASNKGVQNAVTKWTKSHVEKLVKHFDPKHDSSNRAGQSLPYNWENELDIMKTLDTKVEVRGSHALVVGSRSPWVEAILLSRGVGHVTTLEYGKIESDHPHISTITPMEMAKKYLEDPESIQKFDFAVSYSSLEHSGLGRYGDDIDPFGDVIEMQRIRCLLKPKGQALIGFPVNWKERIEFNAHRVYGPLMLSHMFTNWKIISIPSVKKPFLGGSTNWNQPVMLLEKMQ